MGNPLEDFIEDFGQTKEAVGARDVAGAFGNAAMTAGATAVIGGAIGGIGFAASKIYGAATKSRDFRKMMEYNPDLQEHHERDPKMFNQMFTSLRTMNPAYSRDPLVAGTYMRQMADSPLTAGGKLTDTLSTRDKFKNPADKILEGASAAGTGGFMETMKQKSDPNWKLRQEVETTRLTKQRKDPNWAPGRQAPRDPTEY